ncbi:hypothetical protein BC567DRAFT_80250 [Phyllosticta citribraziliensis]
MAAHTPSPTPSRRIISYPGSCAVDFLHGHGRTAGRSVCLCLTIEAPTPAADPSHPFGALWGCLALADLPPCAVGLWRRAGLHSLLPFVGASRCLFSKSWLGDVAAAADSIANIVLALKSHYRAKLGAEIRGTRWMSRYDREHSSSTWCGLRLFHQVLVVLTDDSRRTNERKQPAQRQGNGRQYQLIVRTEKEIPRLPLGYGSVAALLF